MLQNIKLSTQLYRCDLTFVLNRCNFIYELHRTLITNLFLLVKNQSTEHTNTYYARNGAKQTGCAACQTKDATGPFDTTIQPVNYTLRPMKRTTELYSYVTQLYSSVPQQNRCVMQMHSSVTHLYKCVTLLTRSVMQLDCFVPLQACSVTHLYCFMTLQACSVTHLNCFVTLQACSVTHLYCCNMPKTSKINPIALYNNTLHQIMNCFGKQRAYQLAAKLAVCLGLLQNDAYACFGLVPSVQNLITQKRGICFPAIAIVRISTNDTEHRWPLHL